MLIDVSYFVAGHRHILTATLGIKGSPEVNNAIENLIAYHQPLFLCELFGDKLGRILSAYYDDLGTSYVGLYDDIASEIRQAFADYVYFQFISNNTQATPTGIVRLKRPDEYVDPIGKQVKVWNLMVKRLRLFKKWSEGHGVTLSPDTELLTPINIFNL